LQIVLRIRRSENEEVNCCLLALNPVVSLASGKKSNRKLKGRIATIAAKYRSLFSMNLSNHEMTYGM
jgi:hypothetical protein